MLARSKRYDSEWADGVFLGVSGMGIGVLIGTKGGIVQTTDYRTAPVATSFEQYVLPTADAKVVVIDASNVVSEGVPPQIDDKSYCSKASNGVLRLSQIWVRWRMFWGRAFTSLFNGLS